MNAQGNFVNALEQAQEIVVLPVDVATNFNRGFQFKEHLLAHKDFACFVANVAHLLFGQIHILAGAGIFHFQQPRDDIVNVEFSGHLE